ncbi:hypothetical protein [Bacillus stercoris]|uniref:hypothetical protein n=1 Tax=Bacillus stercoris TaxID=2054641 RepID=UPI002ACAAB85|nr:hypothetical protein [Bacillus stercoris]MDZ5668931.1 hypothetical protein [Bacillus stercoris]
MKHPCPVCGFKRIVGYEMQHEDDSYLEPAESIIAYRKQWLADGAVMFSPSAARRNSKKRKSVKACFN